MSVTERRLLSIDLADLRPLPEPAERELIAQHDADIERLLPLLGPLFGIAVLLFSIWDGMIDPVHAPVTCLVRIAGVLLGAPAYFANSFPTTPLQRFAYIYITHAGAIIICQFLLSDGFLYGLAGVTTSVFAASVVALQSRRLLLITAIPSLLFFTLLATRGPLLTFINGAMLYVFSISLACVISLVIHVFRRRAYESEKMLREVAQRDGLTGAYNFRYLTELAEREVALSRRCGRNLAIVMLDVDRFKQVNDNCGHDTGDRLIKLLAKTCMDNLRTIDHFGRIGGDEFICVLPETDEAQALACAERLRRSIESLSVDTLQGILRFSVSIGVALLQPSHADWSALRQDGDIALYRAKHAGRNRVTLAHVQRSGCDA